MCVTQAGKRHLNDSKLYRVMFISPSYHMDGWNGGGIETMEEGQIEQEQIEQGR